MELGVALPQLAGAANLALAVSILALTVARQVGSPRPQYTRSWAFFGLAAVTLLVHASFDLAGSAMSDFSRIAEVGTTALLSVGLIFLYGADREGIDRMKDAADRDHLTGLLNLRAFGILAAERLERTLDNGGRCAVAMLDLDGFKEVNDSLGHQAGDRMLQLVGSAIRATVRPHDIAARYAGDEFVILLDRCEADEAKRVCDRIQRSIVMLSLAAGRQLTASWGVSVAPHGGTDLRDLIHHADKQLIGVKRAGRDAVSAVAS
ncbi:MAG: GGDEF domain-containing protein [Chloroflexi bacterium]|nr:GGDEF domain-containing protein [Chloroflexota bacterium]MBI2983153.1 GGDEF domain-containing protein [Chloroflexota bacterium]